MPDARLRRTRATLPEGYQYGDAGRTRRRTRRRIVVRSWKSGDSVFHVKMTQRFDVGPGWRAPHENAAAQLTRSHVHDFRARYDEGIYFAICAGCGLNAGPVDCSRMEVLCGIGTPTQRTGEETI